MTAWCLAGCAAAHTVPPPPSDAAGLLADAAGHLDTATTFRLTLDTSVPAAQPTATPGPTTAPGPGATSKPPYRISLSGMWDVAAHDARMQGTLNGTASTILAADGVEYISLVAGSGAPAGKAWLKVDGGDGTFGAFSDPHLVAQLLRSYHGLKLSAAGHVEGTILTAEADQHIADPNLIASLAGYPDTITFDVATDASGAPTRIAFRLAGDAAKTSGSVQLLDFGAAAPTVQVPTADQVVEAPSHG